MPPSEVKSRMPLSSPAIATREVDVGMDNAHVPRQCIVSGKGLFLGAYLAFGLLLIVVMDRLLMASQVIGS